MSVNGVNGSGGKAFLPPISGVDSGQKNDCTESEHASRSTSLCSLDLDGRNPPPPSHGSERNDSPSSARHDVVWTPVDSKLLSEDGARTEFVPPERGNSRSPARPTSADSSRRPTTPEGKKLLDARRESIDEKRSQLIRERSGPNLTSLSEDAVEAAPAIRTMHRLASDDDTILQALGIKKPEIVAVGELPGKHIEQDIALRRSTSAPQFEYTPMASIPEECDKSTEASDKEEVTTKPTTKNVNDRRLSRIRASSVSALGLEEAALAKGRLQAPDRKPDKFRDSEPTRHELLRQGSRMRGLTVEQRDDATLGEAETFIQLCAFENALGKAREIKDPVKKRELLVKIANILVDPRRIIIQSLSQTLGDSISLLFGENAKREVVLAKVALELAKIESVRAKDIVSTATTLLITVAEQLVDPLPNYARIAEKLKNTPDMLNESERMTLSALSRNTLRKESVLATLSAEDHVKMTRLADMLLDMVEIARINLACTIGEDLMQLEKSSYQGEKVIGKVAELCAMRASAIENTHERQPLINRARLLVEKLTVPILRAKPRLAITRAFSSLGQCGRAILQASLIETDELKKTAFVLLFDHLANETRHKEAFERIGSIRSISSIKRARSNAKKDNDSAKKVADAANARSEAYTYVIAKLLEKGLADLVTERALEELQMRDPEITNIEMGIWFQLVANAHKDNGNIEESTRYSALSDAYNTRNVEHE